jgi:hypothetical protein
MQDMVVQAASSLPQALAEDVFRSVTPSSLPRVSQWVLRGIERLKNSGSHLPILAEARKVLKRPGPGAPWEEGYRLARDFRKRVELPDQVPIRLETILGENLPLIDAEAPPPHPNLDGLVAAFDTSISFYAAKSRDDSKRFFLARALGVYLEGQSTFPALLSSAITQPQKRSRAFAAELLAPANVLKQHLTSGFVDEEEIEKLARDFGVSSYVISHQITNHKLAEIICSNA